MLFRSGDAVTTGYFSAIVGSGSMEPTVSVNDLLIVKGEKSYQKGDIITYVSPGGSLITHRVEEVSDGGYVAKGDANNIPDEEITEQMVLGKLIYVIPKAGRIIDAVVSPAGIAFWACIFLFVLLIQKIRRDENKDEKEEISINDNQEK